MSSYSVTRDSSSLALLIRLNVRKLQFRASIKYANAIRPPINNNAGARNLATCSFLSESINNMKIALVRGNTKFLRGMALRESLEVPITFLISQQVSLQNDV